jgi:hypothetical protein
MTKERPILFSGAMVRAILDGRKTQTRRVCKPAANLTAVVRVQDPNERGQRPPYWTPGWFGDEDGEAQFYCPYGEPGDRLWVRETWGFNPDFPGMHGRACYRADPGHEYDGIKWKPSIHMPRSACRLVLEITGVRVARLNDCSPADAIAEGIAPELDGWMDYGNPGCQMCLDPVDSYRTLWDSINGAGAWAANPWVWVIEFRRVL